MKKQTFIYALFLVVTVVIVIVGIVFWKKTNNIPEKSPENLAAVESQKYSPIDILAATQNLVSDYIKKNINTLSPIDPVLGGKFYVTAILFTGKSSCIVNYEDGHNALKAQVEFILPSPGKVEITSFTPNEGFLEVGDLIQKGDTWIFLYEEPGKPALSVDLEFNENSVCSNGVEELSCSPYFWSVGSRAELSGEIDSGKLLVKGLKIINNEIILDLSNVTNFEECVDAGYESTYPDCDGCKGVCRTPDGRVFNEEINIDIDFCQRNCGNGTCEDVVCLGEGCLCAENVSTCPEDCK